MNVSKYRKLGGLMLKTVALVKLLKTEKLTENVSEFCVGRALMSFQLRSHANCQTFFVRIILFYFFKNH